MSITRRISRILLRNKGKVAPKENLAISQALQIQNRLNWMNQDTINVQENLKQSFKLAKQAPFVFTDTDGSKMSPL